jgi:hypothetical protein
MSATVSDDGVGFVIFGACTRSKAHRLIRESRTHGCCEQTSEAAAHHSAAVGVGGHREAEIIS